MDQHYYAFIEKGDKMERKPMFLFGKIAHLYVYLMRNKEVNLTKISRDTMTSYAYTLDCIRSMDKAGHISYSAIGRQKLVKLNQKGIDFCKKHGFMELL